jgi:glycosyltransferase involved in cell wall biosynthesis
MKKKILFILPNLRVGGAEKVMGNIINTLSNIKYNKYLLVLNNTGSKKISICKKVKIINLKKNNLRSSVFLLLKDLKTNNYDCIISTFYHLNFFLTFFKPFYRGRLIIRESNNPYFNVQKHIFPFIIKIFYKFLYNRADKIIASSFSMKNELIKLGSNRKKISVIYNPVNFQYFQKMLNSKKTKNYIVYVGRLTYQKSVEKLIYYFEKSKLKELKIVGTGQDIYKLKKISKNINKKITFYRKQDATRIICNAKALVLSSRWEGLPNVVLEAISLCTRVISLTKIDSLLEIIKIENVKSILKIVKKKNEEIQFLNELLNKKELNKKKVYLPKRFLLDNVVRKIDRLINEK